MIKGKSGQSNVKSSNSLQEQCKDKKMKGKLTKHMTQWCVCFYQHKNKKPVNKLPCRVVVALVINSVHHSVDKQDIMIIIIIHHSSYIKQIRVTILLGKLLA